MRLSLSGLFRLNNHYRKLLKSRHIQANKDFSVLSSQFSKRTVVPCE